MRLLILSDIHGSLSSLERVLRFFREQDYDRLVILGDILNYGPRNGLPEGLDALGVVAALNPLADRIAAVRGNCDSEVDQMLLKFPMMQDSSMLAAGGRKFFLTHGHVWNPDRRPSEGVDVLFYGHTHLWSLEREDGGTIVCNTGSITFPKGGNVPTFATVDGDAIRIRDLDGNVLKELEISGTVAESDSACNFEVIRATETYQQAGAYHVRIQAMARRYNIGLREEFDEFDTPDTKYILVTDAGFPVATCRILRRSDTVAEIGRVVVLDEYRSRGLGRLVVESAEEWIREMGYATVVVESRDVAVGFYRKLGYASDPSSVLHDGVTFTCLHMEKQLG